MSAKGKRKVGSRRKKVAKRRMSAYQLACQAALEAEQKRMAELGSLGGFYGAEDTRTGKVDFKNNTKEGN